MAFFSDRFMYWTTYAPASGVIFTAGMDGSNPRSLVAGTEQASGVQIDLEKRRLYWTLYEIKRIQSSKLDGSDVVTIHQLADCPIGIAVVGERLYWGYPQVNTIHSGGVQPGSGIRVEYVGESPTRHFTVPLWNPPRNRTNHCEGVVCSGVCVLKPNSSYRCLAI